MRLIHREIDKHAAGKVTLIAEEAEDIWHAFNLVAVGDSLRTTTIRKVTSEGATGSTRSEKIRLTLTVSVESIDFDTQACMLRVKGKNIEPNQHVKMGAYHTLDLEMNRKFVLSKSEWDSVALQRLDQACDPAQSADIGAVVMQEGLANVCLVTSSMTIVRAKIDVSIPRKRKGLCANHDKAMHKFYDHIIQAIDRHFNFAVIKCVLVASPGFVKDQFFEYMLQQASKLELRQLLDNRSKFLLVHASCGFKHALKEVMQDPALQTRLADTKALGEVQALADFYQQLQTDPDKAVYGVGHVEAAAAQQAVDVLLVTDALFRNQSSVAARRRYVQLVDRVRDSAGDVRIFSSLHVSGEQLGQLSGVAALLRFPLHLDEDTDSDDSDVDGAADIG